MKEGKRLEPSTLSPSERMVSTYSRLFTVKFRVFTLASSAGYMKSTIWIPFSLINLIMSSRVNSLGDFFKKATTSLGLSSILLSIIGTMLLQSANLAKIFLWTFFIIFVI